VWNRGLQAKLGVGDTPLFGLWLDAYWNFDRMNGFIFGFVVAGAVRQLHEGLLAERRGKKRQFFFA
jgi:hypothetical protein